MSMEYSLVKSGQFSARRSMLTGLALIVCLLLGSGSRVLNLKANYSSATHNSCFENSLPDVAVTRLERRGPAADTSPRRQTLFGALPTAVELPVSLVAAERTLAGVRCDSLTTASHQTTARHPSSLRLIPTSLTALDQQ